MHDFASLLECKQALHDAQGSLDSSGATSSAFVNEMYGTINGGFCGIIENSLAGDP
jgi:hypothetical protein